MVPSLSVVRMAFKVVHGSSISFRRGVSGFDSWLGLRINYGSVGNGSSADVVAVEVYVSCILKKKSFQINYKRTLFIWKNNR